MSKDRIQGDFNSIGYQPDVPFSYPRDGQASRRPIEPTAMNPAPDAATVRIEPIPSDVQSPLTPISKEQ